MDRRWVGPTADLGTVVNRNIPTALPGIETKPIFGHLVLLYPGFSA
jgi:hypothetical protein